MVTQLEEERGIPEGKIQFDLIMETARGIVNMESIAAASPRIVQVSIGGVDLTQDMGFIRSPDLNMDQFFYASSKLLFAAKAAGVQASGLWPQNRGDFTDTSLTEEVMLQVCRRSFLMGYLGSSTIHPAWCRPLNEGFKASAAELEFARRVKSALDEAYSKGQGSAAVDGRMVDVANMKQVLKILERAEAVARREAEKEAAMAAAGWMP
jgi:citrate lyase beta subunit